MDEVLAARLVEQRRVIKLQQEELDQLHFEHQVLSEEASRLREAAMSGRPCEVRDGQEVAALEAEEMPLEEDFGVSFMEAVSPLPSEGQSVEASRGREVGRRSSGRSHSGSARRWGRSSALGGVSEALGAARAQFRLRKAWEAMRSRPFQLPEEG